MWVFSAVLLKQETVCYYHIITTRIKADVVSPVMNHTIWGGFVKSTSHTSFFSVTQLSFWPFMLSHRSISAVLVSKKQSLSNQILQSASQSKDIKQHKATAIKHPGPPSTADFNNDEK